MEWTDMIDKSEAVAGRDHAIHVSLTVRSQYIPNGKWMISVLYLDYLDDNRSPTILQKEKVAMGAQTWQWVWPGLVNDEILNLL